MILSKPLVARSDCHEHIRDLEARVLFLEMKVRELEKLTPFRPKWLYDDKETADKTSRN